MTAFSKGVIYAAIFGGIGIAVGIVVTLFVISNQHDATVLQRAISEDDNPWNDPQNIESYNKNVRTGAYYKSSLIVGQEGFFISSAKGGKEPYTYEWRFSDGVVMTDANVTRSFDRVGTYYFNLTVTDADGKQAKSTGMTLKVLENPSNQIVNATQPMARVK